MQSKYKLQHNYIRDWFGEIGNVDRHSILRTYAVFKTKFSQENYIEFLSNKKYQCTISHFRVSSHRLGIETGRHEKPRVPPELRLCKYCESEAVDDELHFLINCEFNLRDRQILFSLLDENIDNFYSLTDIDKFKEILKFQRQHVILALGKFNHDGFKSLDQVYSWTCKLIRLLLIFFIITAKSIVINSNENVQLKLTCMYTQDLFYMFLYPFRSLAHLAHFNVPDTANFGYTGTVCNETFLSCNLMLF